MKALAASTLQTLSVVELHQKHHTLMQELTQLQLKTKTVGVEKPAEFQRLRRDIARVLTVLNARRSP